MFKGLSKLCLKRLRFAAIKGRRDDMGIYAKVLSKVPAACESCVLIRKI